MSAARFSPNETSERATPQLPKWIIPIEDQDSGNFSIKSREEFLLGKEVGTHVVMEIEVVAREVRENGNVEAESLDSFQLDGV
jgi:hypothetical protein